MKKLLSFAAVSLLTTAFLEPLFYSMLDRPIPWIRDVFMAVAGVACFYVLIKYRQQW
jgi:nicotinamide riboside transporter PnuC